MSAPKRRPGGEFYVSVDVETDGPIPGDCNMVSVGASVCGVLLTDGRGFQPVHGKTFYRELTTEFEGNLDTQEWLAAQGFEVNSPHAIEPYDAMDHFRNWIERQREEIGARPVYVAYPLGFDWSFTHWYFEHYLGPKSDPFGFSNAMDIKTLYSALSRRSLLGSTKSNMPGHIKNVEQPHTHNAKDDAVGQGELFANLIQWKSDEDLRIELMHQMDMCAELSEDEAERVGGVIEDVFADRAARR